MNHKSLLSTAAASGMQPGSGLRRIVCLAALLVVFVAGVHAAPQYLVYVGGDLISDGTYYSYSSNKPSALTSGSITYNSGQKLLTLKDAKIVGGNSNGLEILFRGGLTVKLTGKCSITSNVAGILLHTSITFSGDGFLDVVSSNNAGLSLDGGLTVTVTENATVYAEGKTNGIYGTYSSRGKLVMQDNAKLKFKGMEASVKNMDLSNGPQKNGFAITSPEEATYNASSYTIVDANGNEVSGRVVIFEKPIAIDETNLPDENFRNWLLEQSYGKDGYLTSAEIAEVTKIDVSDKSISSLKGIEYFTALEELNCYNNQLTALDFSANTALTTLDCGINLLSALDVSKNTALTLLKCGNNQLTSLDLSNNPALTHLYCTGSRLTSIDLSKNTKLTYLRLVKNQLTSLDLSNNPALTYLYCSYNQLTSLDVSKNTALKELDCRENDLNSLDVSKNTALTVLYCYSNQLESIDVSNNTALGVLFCQGNQLTSLDVSKNTALERLYCHNNQLTSLDVSKNTALTYLDCSHNQISGDAMANLVNSLPFVTGEGVFYVCNDNRTPDNVITTVQVKIATDKHWKVKKYGKYGDQDYVGLGDVNGDNKIDQTDLDTIVDIIMGRVNLGYAGDLNNDGKTNAADVVKMVNVFRSLGKGIW